MNTAQPEPQAVDAWHLHTADEPLPQEAHAEKVNPVAASMVLLSTLVVVAVLVLRKDKVEHKHFRTPTIVPVLGAICCAFLAGPWTGRDPVQYTIGGILIALGIVLWFVTVTVMKRSAQPA